MKWMDDGFHPREERDERVSRNGKVVVVGSLDQSVVDPS